MTTLALPPAIDKAAHLGAALAVSISGGKDSQAILRSVVALHATKGWTGPIFAVHADLGQADWHESLPVCHRLAAEAGVELVVVQRSKGDLVDRIVQRQTDLAGTGKPFWPSAAQRYCTSDLKRDPINIYLRKFPLIISTEGIRAEESPMRRKKPVCQVRQRITAKKLHGASPLDAVSTWEPEAGRLALDWYPIHGWTEDAVYQDAGHSLAERDERRGLYRAGRVEEAFNGWTMHPAYVLGSNRVSCALCILASLGDLKVGARHNQDLYRRYRQMEAESGFTFKQGWSLAALEE